jgi:uncharacterized protein (TIRG00374 family)
MSASLSPAIMADPPRMRRVELAVLLGVVVFALGMAAAAVWGGGRQAWATLQTIPANIVPVLLAMSAVNYLMRALRWLLFSKALGLRVQPGVNALYYVAGFSMTTTPGKMGEALRLWLLARFHGCRYEQTAALLVADRLSDAVATTAVVAFTVFWFAHYAAVALVAVLGVAGIATLALRPRFILSGIDTVFARLRRWPRLFVRARRAVRAMETLAPPRVFGPALLLGLVGWCSEGLSFFVLLHALGAAVSPLSCMFIFSFSMLVGAISILPGGLGSTEATMIGLLASQGVPFEIALVATGMVRVTTLWFAVGLGLLVLPLALSGRAVSTAYE